MKRVGVNLLKCYSVMIADEHLSPQFITDIVNTSLVK